MLDGETSLDEIKDRVRSSSFPPQKITVEELQQFVGMLHRSGLVIADVPGQGEQLQKRRDEAPPQELLGRLTNILAHPLQGDRSRSDPQLALSQDALVLQPAGAVVCCCLLALVGADAGAGAVRRRSTPSCPTFHQFFDAKNWIYLGVTLAVTKVIHEFGHGLTCKHFGGECHEMGVMFLVLTPCLYCNVSDSWMLPNKWQRASIGAAGMYVEIVIASICTFLWWFSEPGLLQPDLPEHDVRLLGQHA